MFTGEFKTLVLYPGVAVNVIGRCRDQHRNRVTKSVLSSQLCSANTAACELSGACWPPGLQVLPWGL